MLISPIGLTLCVCSQIQVYVSICLIDALFCIDYVTKCHLCINVHWWVHSAQCI